MLASDPSEVDADKVAYWFGQQICIYAIWYLNGVDGIVATSYGAKKLVMDEMESNLDDFIVLAQRCLEETDQSHLTGVRNAVERLRILAFDYGRIIGQAVERDVLNIPPVLVS